VFVIKVYYAILVAKYKLVVGLGQTFHLRWVQWRIRR